MIYVHYYDFRKWLKNKNYVLVPDITQMIFFSFLQAFHQILKYASFKGELTIEIRE